MLDIIGLVFGILGRGLQSLFTFLTTKPGIYVSIAIIAVGAYWYSGHTGFNRGYSQREAEYQVALLTAQREAYRLGMERQAKLDHGLEKVAYEAGKASVKAKERTIYLTKEVTHYVTEETDHGFPMPCSLVLLHDAAALGVGPEDIRKSACGPNGETLSVKASDLATIIIENYGLYHQAEAQIAGLQELARALAVQISGE